MQLLEERENQLTHLLNQVQHLNDLVAALCTDVKRQYQIEPSTDVVVLKDQLSNLRNFFSVLKVTLSAVLLSWFINNALITR
jgi:hypothetical protein